MTALYNEIESYPAQWLCNLEEAGHIAPGAVVEGDMRTMPLRDLLGKYDQAHFFAGIGAWSYALRLAGWPDDVPVWTGSCPCQPFSSAGRKKGFADDRHLWPDWFKLIEQCRPPIIFGEQVASPAGLAWFDTVSADLEGAGYAVGAADLCAAGIGAPHIRQRLYFVAVAGGERRERLGLHLRERRQGSAEPEAARRGAPSIVGDTSGPGGWRYPGAIFSEERAGFEAWVATRSIADELEFAGATGGAWAGCDWLLCRDEKLRPAMRGSFPLAARSANRVGKLRAYGNAIVPQVAAEFIGAVIDYLETNA